MSFAEYYLAYKSITAPDKNIRILLMDRALSGERASLLYNTSNRELWKENSSLIGYEVGDVTVDVNDLGYGRYCLRKEKGPLSVGEICKV